jgi:hypothetical protein
MTCPLDDPEMIAAIAAKAKNKTAEETATIREDFLETLNPRQKQLWMTFEETIEDQIVRTQEYTIKALRCPICPTTSCPDRK